MKWLISQIGCNIYILPVDSFTKRWNFEIVILEKSLILTNKTESVFE